MSQGVEGMGAVTKGRGDTGMARESWRCPWGEVWGSVRVGVPAQPLVLLQARNEPDVYETSDLPEDDQAEFEAVRPGWWGEQQLGRTPGTPRDPPGPAPWQGTGSTPSPCTQQQHILHSDTSPPRGQ